MAENDGTQVSPTGVTPQIGTGKNSVSDSEATPTHIGKFLLNWQNRLEIATDGLTNTVDITKAKWARLAAGINILTPAENDSTAND